MFKESSDISYWWNVAKDDLISALHTNIQTGLTQEQVKQSCQTYGSNVIEHIKPAGIIQLIVEGVKEPMMILLLSIAGLNLLFGKPAEAIVMIFVVAAYIAVECINKFRSDRIMVKLRALSAPMTKVIREGKELELPTEDLVVGDVVILSEGVRVPADIRLITSYGLLVDEASLTGESLAVEKNADAKVPKDALTGDRINCVFSGTMVLSGQAQGIVMAVGLRSELEKLRKNYR